METQDKLLDLPDHLLALIIQKLSPTERKVLRSVNHRFHDVLGTHFKALTLAETIAKMGPDEDKESVLEAIRARGNMLMVTPAIIATLDSRDMKRVSQSLATCAAMIDRYGTNNYLLWGYTSEELAAGASLPQKERASRGPALARFMQALTRTNAGGLVEMVNFCFDLHYPSRGNGIMSAASNAG